MRRLLQIVSGRPKQETYVWLHMIGAAVEFVGLLIESKRFIGDVEKVRRLCGKPLSRSQLVVLPNSGTLLPRLYIMAASFFFLFHHCIFCQ